MASLQHPPPKYRLQIPKRPRLQQLSLPHPPPQRSFQWTTTHTFSGASSRKTNSFTISDHWRIIWNSNLAAIKKRACVVVSLVDAPDGGIRAGGVQTICEQNTPSSVYEIYGGGQVCLYILSSGEWTVQVQEWK